MNRFFLSVVALCCAALSGCAQLERTSHGSWLDRIGEPAAGSEPAQGPEAVAMRAEAAELRARANAIRARLAVEPDRVRRLDSMRELREIGDRLNPLEAALRQGPQPSPSVFGIGS